MVPNDHVLNDLWIIFQLMVASVFDPSGLGIFQNHWITAIQRPMNPLFHGGLSVDFCCVVESVMLFELIMGFQSFFCDERKYFKHLQSHINSNTNFDQDIIVSKTYQRDIPKEWAKNVPQDVSRE